MQIIVLPPFASDFMSCTTWNDVCESRPDVGSSKNITEKVQELFEKNLSTWRIIAKFKANGESFALSAGKRRRLRVTRVIKSERGDDLIHELLLVLVRFQLELG